ncbi:MAG: type II toxin-antitoxin system VapC family toxin [Aestuariivirga sp.]|nr:type II toxin-antitoxin system VapC family toxin [Aestuariivirga sp.]
MKLLIDTHFVILLADDWIDQSAHPNRDIILHESSEVFVSVASLWEVEIKSRIGKLPLKDPVRNWSGMLENAGARILPVELQHVVADIGPEPEINDPFDRLLPSTCAAEKFRLVTVDRALVDHPLAWRG